jgi:steroid 5-alpha reductase family enzyme
MSIGLSPLTLLMLSLGLTLAAFTLVWAISIVLKDASIIDWYWGPGFLLIAAVTFALSSGRSAWQIIFLACVSVWAIRLGLHMVLRHRRKGVEDPRYARMRHERGAGFPVWSLWAVFWLQAIIQWLVASPIHVMLIALGPPVLAPVMPVGLALFLAGFALEVTADRQLARFKADPANAGQVFTRGLFARVRHPNYLGEIVLWSGLGLMAFGQGLNPLALIGPALLAVIMIRISGPPMLATLMQDRPGYAAWAAETPALWPFRRRR